MTDDKITARIRDLLKLASSDNVHEAGNAAAQAQALMSKYAITEAMVDVGADADELEEVIEVGLLHKHDAQNMPSWKRTLCTVMCKVNQCHGYSFGNELRIIGRPGDATTVRYLFSYVSREINRLADVEAELRGSPGRTWKNNFRLGAVQEVNSRLREAFKGVRAQMKQDADRGDTMGTGTALACVNDALAKLDTRRENAVQYGKKKLGLRTIRRSSARSLDGREAGKRAGANINLARGGNAALKG